MLTPAARNFFRAFFMLPGFFSVYVPRSDFIPLICKNITLQMINIITESLGYLAFIFLAISLLVTNDIKFRWINGLGGFSFVLYGLLIGAFPIVLTNVVLFAINVYFLIKIYRKQEKFDLVEFNQNAAIVPKFLSFYENDIQRYFPDFELTDNADEVKFIVLRDIAMANIFVAKLDDRGNAVVQINYTVPKYRDFKVGRFLFDEGKRYLVEKGVRKIIYLSVANPAHKSFLQVMGFTNEWIDGKQCMVKNIG